MIYHFLKWRFYEIVVVFSASHIATIIPQNCFANKTRIATTKIERSKYGKFYVSIADP
jgi:hypothetical protein